MKQFEKLKTLNLKTCIRNQVGKEATREVCTAKSGISWVMIIVWHKKGVNKSYLLISLFLKSIEFKAAGLIRKRLKKRSNVRLTDKNKEQRQIFCFEILGLRTRQIYFLDESGFNLHTSINYGYSLANEEAILHQSASRGRNISLCCMISSSGVEKFEITEGFYRSHGN